MNKLKVPHDTARRRLFRRSFGGLGALFLAGCDRLNDTPWFTRMLSGAETVSRTVHKAIVPRKSMAQEFTEADLSPRFRSNGTSNPDNPAYQAMASKGFADWALQVDGLVEKPGKFTLAQLQGMPKRTQITRHDCVEGWSAIAKWTGVPLSQVLAAVKPTGEANYVVFHCADPMGKDGKDPYYESIDMDDANHPQTILAYELNDKTLPVANGAPVRLRVERQLGYKHAKYVMRIELVDSRGYWEDNYGYQWYAGI
jgi:DMSO/TMAO reductase YedYZ molybdopterin-dependent catalytic subunit